jgi:hypothetical protein
MRQQRETVGMAKGTGEGLKLTAKMMTKIPPQEIGGMMSGIEASDFRLVRDRGRNRLPQSQLLSDDPSAQHQQNRTLRAAIVRHRGRFSRGEMSIGFLWSTTVAERGTNPSLVMSGRVVSRSIKSGPSRQSLVASRRVEE